MRFAHAQAHLPALLPLAILTALALSPAAAHAGKDSLFSSAASASVYGTSVASTTSLAGASGNRNLTLTEPIVGAQPVTVHATWSIGAGSSPRTTTYPKNGVSFSAITTNGTSVGPITVAPATCDLSGTSATCSTTASFTTPNVSDTIQLKVTPSNTGTGNSALSNGSHLFVNFSVIAQVAKLDTVTTLTDPVCAPYKGSTIDLPAKLSTLVGGVPLSGKAMDFAVNSIAAGSASTGVDGVATLPFTVDGLAAGDHALYAEFLGDAGYNGSNDGATLGIYYNFVGFQPPINPEGNSIFNGGRVVPVKIKLVDANLNPVTDAKPTVWVYQWSPGTGLGEILETPTSVSSADQGNTMRYSPTDQHYIYNWDLEGLTNGTYAVVVELGDGKACSKGPYYATFTVAKKKK